MPLGQARRQRRGGVTLVEIAIVIAIIGILAAVAGTLLNDTLPSWRTRRASRELSAALNQCRQLAIAQGVEYRVRMADSDPDLNGSSESVGSYFIERGNAATGSTAWDILPWDMDGSGTETGEGTVVLTEGGEDAQRGVSIAPWNPISGVDGDDIVFSPRGWLVNPVSDFNADGYVEITFVNKRARANGQTDDWTVMVSRGGLVRLESNRQTPVGAPSGTPSASEWTTSGATGHAP
ncbi:MAG: GspH/FimT family pseudopilin [Pseudomonadota bacterium]|nr:GspH/FimT family pseudopilin [Pseudomonadota bacterium]